MFSQEEVNAISNMGRAFGIDARCLLALGLQESGGQVFWIINGQKVPALRPEPHHFYKHLSRTPEKQQEAVSKGLAHPQRLKIKIPRTWRGVYDFFQRMSEIDVEAACASCSIGWGQVLGSNCKMLGYKSASHLFNRAMEGLEGQTEMVCRYIVANNLVGPLNALPDPKAAATFARAYNGPAYRENNYDNELIENWETLDRAQMRPAGRSTVDLQRALTTLGYYKGSIDGIHGRQTATAVRQYQHDEGLAVDGIAGKMTWEALHDDLQAVQTKKKEENKTKVGGLTAAVATPAVILQTVNQIQEAAPQVQEMVETMGLGSKIGIALVLALAAYIVYVKFFGAKDKEPVPDASDELYYDQAGWDTMGMPVVMPPQTPDRQMTPTWGPMSYEVPQQSQKEFDLRQPMPWEYPQYIPKANRGEK